MKERTLIGSMCINLICPGAEDEEGVGAEPVWLPLGALPPHRPPRLVHQDQVRVRSTQT